MRLFFAAAFRRSARGGVRRRRGLASWTTPLAAAAAAPGGGTSSPRPFSSLPTAGDGGVPPEKTPLKKPPQKKSAPQSLGGGRGEISLREALRFDPLDVTPPDLNNWNVLFDFSEPATVADWLWASDKDIGGESTCSLEHVPGSPTAPSDRGGIGGGGGGGGDGEAPTPEWADETPISGLDLCTGTGFARFSGNLSMDFTGSATRSGYAMARSQEPLQPLDLGEYKGLAMRVRSPLPYQRPYGVNVRTESFLPDEVFIGILQLNSTGWVTVQLPFDAFTLTGRGHIRAIQRHMPTHEFLTVGFACTEKVPGPYHLDVAWIAAVRDMLGDEDVLKMNYSGGVLDAASGIIR